MPLEILRARAAKLPAAPGVYLFKDARGRALYVGKAKRIRDRVRAHLVAAPRGPKGQRLLEEAVDIDVIVTDSELEALALENSLIKQNRPKYNVLLRDDKNYPYLRLTVTERFPRLQLVRGVEDDGNRYFGPYMPASSARLTQTLVYRTFGVRPCNIDIDGSWERPCLYYDIGECAGPCVEDLCPEGRYAELVEEARGFLEGGGAGVEAELERRMRAAAEALEFERAARYRDLLEAVRLSSREQKVASTGLEDRDLFAFHREGERVALQVFLVRRGLVVERKQFFWDDVGGHGDAELLSTFLQQYYHGETFIPPEVCVSLEPPERALLEAWLRQLRGGSVRLVRPRRGARRRLLEMVAENARLALEARLEGTVEPALETLRELLGLEARPQVVECVDVSNTQAGDIVAGLVRFRGGEAEKSGYRRFRIRGVEGPDDVASMAQAVRRHFRRVAGGQRPAPDLLLLDGGRGQLGAALQELAALGLREQPVAAIAKGEETLYLPGRSLPVPLARYPEALRLVQRIRDEAHRFAVAYHRKLRGRRSLASVLEEVRGVGPARRRALLRRFGSAAGVASASQEALAAVVGPRLAARIKERLAAAGEGGS